MHITPFMYKYINKTVKDGDFKQEIFLKMLEKSDAPTFENEEQERNWSSAFIANHLNVSHRNGLNRARLMEENDSEIRNLYGYNDTVDDPLDIILADEFEDSVLRGLSSLEKDIYGLYHSGESYLMISEALKMSQEAVRKHVSRIKGKFNVKIQ